MIENIFGFKQILQMCIRDRPASSVAVYGGNDGILFEQQKKGLTLGADVVIATPGRLIAHLSILGTRQSI